MNLELNREWIDMFEFITRDKAVFLNRDDHKNTNFCTKRNQTCFANIWSQLKMCKLNEVHEILARVHDER